MRLSTSPHCMSFIFAAALLCLIGSVDAAEPESTTATTSSAETSQNRLPTTFEKSPITISKETTVLLGPVRPDGYIDYCAAIQAREKQGVTPENNAAVLLLQATGPREISDESLPFYCSMLGIPTVPREGNYLTEFVQYVPRLDPEEQIRQEDIYDELMNRPWTREEFPAGGKWLDQNIRPLEIGLEATRRPRYYTPLFFSGATSPENNQGPLIAFLLPQAQSSRSLARIIAARSMNRIAEGSLDDAWNDAQALHRLGRLIGQGPTLIEGLVGVAIDSMAIHCERQVINSPRLTRVQAVRYLESLSQWKPVFSPADQVDQLERLMFCDSVGYVLNRGPEAFNMLFGSEGEQSTVEKIVFRVGIMSVDANEVLRVGNRWFDKLVASMRIADPVERRTALKVHDAEFKKMREKMTGTRGAITAFVGSNQDRGEMLGEVLLSLLLPATQSVCTAADRNEVGADLSKIGLAVRLYLLDEQQPPATLDALVPKYLPEIPNDRFGTGALILKRTDSGVLVYSVGADGIDDGGKGYDHPAEQSRSFDDLSVSVTIER